MLIGGEESGLLTAQ
jgi:hypothetical protein